MYTNWYWCLILLNLSCDSIRASVFRLFSHAASFSLPPGRPVSQDQFLYNIKNHMYLINQYSDQANFAFYIFLQQFFFKNKSLLNMFLPLEHGSLYYRRYNLVITMEIMKKGSLIRLVYFDKDVCENEYTYYKPLHTGFLWLDDKSKL